MLKDLRHAVRVLVATKGWTAVVIVSLALGIGANTALFSAVNTLLIATVPVPDPGTLVRLKWYGKNDMVRNTAEYGFSRPGPGDARVTSTFSYDMFLKLRAANQTLTDLTAFAPAGSVNVVIDGAADLASAAFAAGNYFTVLRVRPLVGRVLQEADDRPDAPPAAVVSHAYWARRLGSDPAVEGRVVTMNTTPVTIVGVLPDEYTGIQRPADTGAEVILPLSLDPTIGQDRLKVPTSWWLQIVGRLKPGVTIDQTLGNFSGVFQQTARAGMAAFVASLSDAERGLAINQRGDAVPHLLVGSASRGIYDPDTNATRSASILSAVVVLVLLIVCANVGNLLLARSAGRRKEISVRLSMGASRSRLIRQLLTESLVVAVAGGALGVLVAYWARPLLPFGQNTSIDWRVLAFTAGVSVAAGIAFGLLPALCATRIDLAGVMKETSRSVAGTRTMLSRGLLVLQVAISLVLLVGAGLFLQTLANLRTVDVGFNPSNLLTFRVNPGLNRYDATRTRQLFRELRQAIAAVPGVRTAALAQPALLSGSTSISVLYREGETTSTDIYVVTVSPEFFETMEIPLLSGRTYSTSDGPTSPKVLVINDTAARKLFPDGRVLGRSVGSSAEQASDTEIVGVVRDARYNSLRDAVPPTMFRLDAQTSPRAMNVLVRTGGDPAAHIDAIRGAVRRVDPQLPLAAIATQTDNIAQRFAQERLFAVAYSWFSALALVIAGVGLFGLMSYSVSRRTNEIGVRMALGANGGSIARMVLRESMLLVVIGVVLGGAAAAAAGSLVESILFGVAARDLTTMTAATVVMCGVAFAGAYLPARRASRVDPMVALRYE